MMIRLTWNCERVIVRLKLGECVMCALLSTICGVHPRGAGKSKEAICVCLEISGEY